MSRIHIVTDAELVTFDVPVRYEPPRHFQAFTMPDDGGMVAVRGTATHRFAGDAVYMPKYDEREGALNAL